MLIDCVVEGTSVGLRVVPKNNFNTKIFNNAQDCKHNLYIFRNLLTLPIRAYCEKANFHNRILKNARKIESLQLACNIVKRHSLKVNILSL